MSAVPPAIRPPLQLELMPLEEKAPEPPPFKSMVVRYGYLREIGEFPSDISQKVGCGTKLILRTDRGTEIGEMLTTTCGNGGCSKSITRDKLLSYIQNSGAGNYPFSEQGRVLRVATTQDLAEQAKLDENRPKHLTLARELVRKHNLAMKVVDVEHLLGGERVLFYFVSEHRVDFRGLVRDLAHELRTRIELRQVGARDEARLTADYEKCGQHCCCKQFLKVLTPISMRAAKVQKATLDPTKISGRCGRLMCCLRYEDETYEELRKKLPKRNTRVRTEQAEAWVIDGQILTQLVLVQFDDGKREAVPMEKILEFDRPKPVMPDGRVMQTPNDRPMGLEGGPAGRRGPGNGPPGRRPKPGAPVQAPSGDPLSQNGPTGGDLNGGGDAIDDLIADAMDDGTAPAMEQETDDPRASPPASAGLQNMPPNTTPGTQQPPQRQDPRRGNQRPARGGAPGGQSFRPGPRPPFKPHGGPGQRPMRPQDQSVQPPVAPMPPEAIPPANAEIPAESKPVAETPPDEPPAPPQADSPPPPPAV